MDEMQTVKTGLWPCTLNFGFWILVFEFWVKVAVKPKVQGLWAVDVGLWTSGFGLWIWSLNVGFSMLNL